MNLSMLVTFVKPLLPKAVAKAKEKKESVQLIGDETDVVIILFESDNKAYGCVATINSQNHIKRQIRTEEISEFLKNVTF